MKTKIDLFLLSKHYGRTFKFWSLFFCSFLFMVNLNAQDKNDCGNKKLPAKYKYDFSKPLPKPQRRGRSAEALGQQSTNMLKKIPVDLVVVYKSDGTGNQTEGELRAKFARMNEICARSGWNIQFELKRIVKVNDDAYYALPGQWDKMTELRDKHTDYPNVVPLIQTGDIGNGGYADVGWLAITGNFGESTWLHEIGHFFGLLHTHETQWGDGPELVNGTNCDNTGDLICDTPATPNTHEMVDGCCNYDGTVKDANGEYYNPDVSNCMGYGNLGRCPRTMTAGQEQRVLSFLESKYPEMGTESATKDYATVIIRNESDKKIDTWLNGNEFKGDIEPKSENAIFNLPLDNELRLYYHGGDGTILKKVQLRAFTTYDVTIGGGDNCAKINVVNNFDKRINAFAGGTSVGCITANSQLVLERLPVGKPVKFYYNGGNGTVLKEINPTGCETYDVMIEDIPASERYIAIKTSYDFDKSDNVTVTDKASVSGRKFGYVYQDPEGYILSEKYAGSIDPSLIRPLKLYYHKKREDYKTIASEAAESDAKSVGYQFVETLGYLYKEQQPGTKPLKLFWNADRTDNHSTALKLGEKYAVGAKYKYIRVEGYLYEKVP